ncbi:proactivator polypeptide-like 1 [Triticum urartu]|uniref:Saposin B-type domain-containing protein n=1 Tax=Triticum urartu TaxID=4572 RepID=A0A8R7PPM4_TRIUA|nr:proactivator polypeptide-like 1 [Triticum urartu]
MAVASSTRTSRRLAFVLLVLAFSAALAESRDAYMRSADRYACILTQENFPPASRGSGLTSANGKLCVLCEQYSTEALVYLRQNETQTEILSVLHHTCANLGPLRQQCITLVDYYIPAFFLEVSVVKPEELCESAHLCPKGAATLSSTRGDACGLCHHVLVEVLMMLKDPNTKLEIVGLLFKTCSKAKNYEPQCKRLVLDYIPLILLKTQEFLETTDICFATHACKTGMQATIPLSAAL